MKKKNSRDPSAAAWFHEKNKKGDAAISAAAKENKKEDVGLANIGNGLVAPRSQLGFGTGFQKLLHGVVPYALVCYPR